MKKVALFATALVAVFAVSSSAMAGGGVNRSVTINFVGDQYGGAFYGELSSNKGACFKNRKVKVKTTDAYGNDTIGSDRTSQSGEYAVVEEAVATADYVAKARKKKIRNDKGQIKFVCPKAVSPPISAP